MSQIEIGAITAATPATFSNDTQRRAYTLLETLGVEFERVDCTDAVSMDDCRAIDRALGVPTVKTLFLCNRQQTRFYLFIMPGDKPFSTKDFGRAMQISRVSFAPEALMLEMLGISHGAAGPLSMVADSEGLVEVAVDAEVAALPRWACPDCTTTCYMSLASADVLGRLLPATGHTPRIIEVTPPDAC